MAETKRSTNKKSTSTGKSAKKSTTGKGKKTTKTSTDTAAMRAVADAEKGGTMISTRAICALVTLVLFILFAVMAFNPEGALPELIRSFLLGIFGKAAFYISVPGLLWLFVILTLSHGRPVRLRSFSLIGFVLCCGCLSHFMIDPIAMPGGVKVLGELYHRGINGASAGLICGGIAELLRWLCGNILTCIILSVAGIILLLSAMNLTIPSIIRAIHNRPRPEFEEEEELPPRPEPAEVVVNHIANKQIEMAQRRRQKKAERAAIDIPIDDQPVQRSAADELMSAIDADPTAPVAASQMAFTTDISADAPAVKEPTHRNIEPTPELPPIKNTMPPFVLEDEPALIEEESEPEVIPFAEPAPVVSESVKKVSAKDAADSAAEVAQQIAQNAAEVKPEYCYPPIDLLKLPSGGSADGTDEMRDNSRRLNETLASFKIEARIINVTRGPSVTRYEVELEKGVRLSKLTSCADDIALSLGATGVRIAAVPGKISVVGIEVPNRAVTTVSLREVIDSAEFSKAKSKSSFAVGKDIGGNSIVGNIAKLPHMLIAGTTGSGKSVCMNSVIISLLYKASPDDVKLIMVDPKMVELGIYNGIPHLLIPVVTDPKKAAGSLQWAVTEMMRRYRAMSDAGVRDLESYNAIIDSQEEAGQHLPQVVVIIDELADLMLVAAKEVEESICRIAQMGRAAGIHLIIATQRPSADVITGLMKANIPSRIAFAVASAMESRIILDTQGAEKLVGKGDMLYAPIGCGKPKRVQGCFVSDSEVEAVASYVKSNFTTNYDQQVMEEIEKKAEQTGNKGGSQSDPEPTSEELGGDEMLPAAVDVILETGQASVSMLQRRLKLGYARAARIVDEMEDKGIVGPFMGSKPRSILITKEQWQAMKNGSGAQMSMDDIPADDFSDCVPDELD